VFDSHHAHQRPVGEAASRPAVSFNARAGAAELDELGTRLTPPCRAGEYTLTGQIARTSNTLVYTATGGVFGTVEGVLKLTGAEYAPLLERELQLLNRCRECEVKGIVQPAAGTLIRLPATPHSAATGAVAIALPFLSGGDLVQLVQTHAARAHRLGPELALHVGRQIIAVLRDLLLLERPIVHGDVKLQNVLLPRPDAPLTELTLIDLDSARELTLPLSRLAEAPPESAVWLAEDVRAFGELLYQVATGHQLAPDQRSNGVSATGNPAFDTLVWRCFESAVDPARGYVCLADEGLRVDLQRAVDAAASQRSWPARLQQRLMGFISWRRPAGHDVGQ
jgi:serine/threonine protein kinase